jgi:lipopolysaccharide transport system permease protein
MLDSLRQLWARRDLLYMITWREITIKYKQSVMGALWALLMPVVIVGAGVLVRTGMAYVSKQPLSIVDIAAVSLKSVPWAFVVAGIRFATGSLIANSNLLTKIYLPREIFPLASIAAQLVDFGVAVVPLAVLLAVTGVGVSWQLLWVPLVIAVLIAQVAALGVLLAVGSLFFRDVKYLVDIALTFAIFVTPVFYDVDMFGHWRTLLLLNPIAPLLEALSTTVLRHQPPDLPWLGYSVLFTVLVGLIAALVFRRVEPYFAESV